MPTVKSCFIERGGLWVLGQFALLAVALLGGFFWSSQWENTATWALGWVFMLVAAVFGVYGVRALGRNLTPFPKPLDHAHLVTEGIYGWVRHPLYTAVICWVIGWGLVRESGPAMLCAGLLLVVLDRKARHEEVHLGRIFPGYQDYAGRVKRIIPWVY